MEIKRSQPFIYKYEKRGLLPYIEIIKNEKKQ